MALENIPRDYILMPETDTYALGMYALQKQCRAENNPNQPKILLPYEREVYRTNTFLENILARINDFNILTNPDGTPRSMVDRLAFFSTWLDSSCGIAYKEKSTELKLQLICPTLIDITPEFNGKYIPVNYTSFKEDVKLDHSSKTFARDGWLALLEERNDIYTEYLTVLKSLNLKDDIPGFWTKWKTPKHELRTVLVSSLGNLSNADGCDDLSYPGSFLRRNPSLDKQIIIGRG